MITIRQEEKKDHQNVFQLIEEAFKNIPQSDHQEHFLVERLRKSDAFIPELSLVAEYIDDDSNHNEIVGHILFTKLKIEIGSAVFGSLALAPVSVKPEFQNQGIGGQLITFGHFIAKELGYESIILIGHEEYYPRFGYQKTTNFGISFPFEIPEVNGMAIELIKDSLKNKKGTVKYPKEFGLN
jgi:predicted N-acetyltransferase YhbS